MKSIQSRLNTALALSLVAVFILLGVGVSVSIRLLTESYIASRLDHDAEALLAALQFRPGQSNPIIRLGRINPVYQRAFSGHYYRIEWQDQVIRSRSLWDMDLEVPRMKPGETRRLRLTGPVDQLLLVRVAGYRKDEKDFSIAVAEDMTPIKADVRHFQLQFIVFCIGALGVLLLIQRYILRSGFAPLREIRDEIDSLAKGECHQLKEAVPGEIQPLVRQINRLLEIMQQRLKRSRTAMGNLAHALKTPLTLVSQLAEREELNRCTGIQRDLRQYVDSIRGLMDRELKRARLAGGSVSGGRLRLDREVDELVKVLRALYQERQLTIDVSIDPGVIANCDREDLLELLGNLLDNACKWGREQVRISAYRAPGSVRIVIEDDGPGMPEEVMERIQRGGVRADEAQVPGNGLGLAIAMDVVQQYDGEMTFSRSTELGGLQVEITLPELSRPGIPGSV